MVQETHTQTLYQLAGWDGEGDRERFKREGLYVYLWLIHVEVWQKTEKCWKAIIFQLKKIYDRKRDTDVQNRIFESVGEGEGGMFQENSIKSCILSRVKQATSQVCMHETSARTWCPGKTQRDRVEREVGGGTGMGNTCKSMADSCQCMAKTTMVL